MRKTNLISYFYHSKGRVIFILLLCIQGYLDAQFYEYGQDAGSLKWEQFRTPHYRVIYPQGVDSVAQAFADRLEYFYPTLGEALDHRHSNMPVVVHNESSFSNGVFVWAPKRLEIFTNPDPNGYHQDWLTQLALHEGRHAVQIDKLNQGITRAFYYIAGEQAVGAMAGFLPYWYLEGDAVDAETRLSKTGRGRQPSFEKELKAQMLEAGKTYSFSKATMGSYRDFIPDHYRLGYLMVRHGRRNYGDRFWIDFQEYAARKPYLVSPTYFSMRKYGIRSKDQFYRESLEEYAVHWKQTASGRQYTPYEAWESRKGKTYTSYSYPFPVSDKLLFAYKSGIDQIPEFILMGKGGQEKVVCRPGFLSSGRVGFSGTHVVWDEFVPDTRWSNRNFSVIRTCEVATGRVVNLGNKTRYYAPAFSKDGSRIAVIEQSDRQRFSLVILGLDGKVEQSIPSPGNRFLQHPVWMEGDTALVMVVSGEEGKALYSYAPGSGKWDRLFDAGYDDISLPFVRGDSVFFSGTFSGIDNIYCLEPGGRQVFQVTSTRYGAFQPAVSKDGRTLVYSSYTSRGYDIAEMPLERGLWIPLEQARDHTEQLDYGQTEKEKEITAPDVSMDSVDYPSRRYYKALHLFNFHSWLPLYFDYLDPELNLTPGHLPVSPGVSLVSQNRLSTAVSQLGYEYRNGFHFLHSGIQLKGRYPVFNLYFDVGGEPDVIRMDENDSITSLPPGLKFTTRSYVPLRFNTGKFISIVQPGIDYNYRRDIQYVESEQSYRTGAHYIHYRLYGSVYLRRGTRDILPRLGLTTTLGYYHAPFGNQVYGAVARAGLTGYLPGVLKHQTVRVSVNYQKQYPLDPGRPAFINLMSLPRGLRGIFGEELTGYGIDYVSPLFYPDLELGPFIYLKRIRGALWADHLAGRNVVVSDPRPRYADRDYTTFGIELTADLHLLRIAFPLSLGGRTGYNPATGETFFEWIYSIDIN